MLGLFDASEVKKTGTELALLVRAAVTELPH
jgi:hypothetical protein